MALEDASCSFTTRFTKDTKVKSCPTTQEEHRPPVRCSSSPSTARSVRSLFGLSATRVGIRGSTAPMLKLIQRLIRMEWPVRLAAPLFGKFNPFLPEFRRDPYPTYARLRREAPVYRSRPLGGFILTRHRDIVAILGDPRSSVDRNQSEIFRKYNPFTRMRPEFAEAITRSLLMLDAPDHTRLRKLVVKAFTPRTVERLRQRIEVLVDELLDAVEARGTMDLVADFAYPLPVIVIAEMLGLPPADRDRHKHWSDDVASVLDPFQATNGMDDAERSFFELKAYLEPIFEARRRAPQDDLISGLVAVRDGSDVLSDSELLSLCTLLLAAGNETTTNLIGNAVLALLRHPREKQLLREAPELRRAAVEEFLRYDSPVQLTDRLVTRDFEIDGHVIRKGQLVGLILGAANRDPEVFAEPDRLRFDRGDVPHLAFSHGAHFCLGAQLARLETEIAIGRLLERFPNFDGPLEPPGRKRSIVLRGPLSLPLQLHA